MPTHRRSPPGTSCLGTSADAPASSATAPPKTPRSAMPTAFGRNKVLEPAAEARFGLRMVLAPPFPEELLDVGHVAAAGDVFHRLVVDRHHGRADKRPAGEIGELDLHSWPFRPGGIPWSPLHLGWERARVRAVIISHFSRLPSLRSLQRDRPHPLPLSRKERGASWVRWRRSAPVFPAGRRSPSSRYRRGRRRS